MLANWVMGFVCCVVSISEALELNECKRGLLSQKGEFRKMGERIAWATTRTPQRKGRKYLNRIRTQISIQTF